MHAFIGVQIRQCGPGEAFNFRTEPAHPALTLSSYPKKGSDCASVSIYVNEFQFVPVIPMRVARSYIDLGANEQRHIHPHNAADALEYFARSAPKLICLELRCRAVVSNLHLECIMEMIRILTVSPISAAGGSGPAAAFSHNERPAGTLALA